MPAGSASAEELEGMPEDACLLEDASFLRNLFDVDAVLLAQGTSQVRGRSAIANVIKESGRLALIISGANDLGRPAEAGRLALRDQSA